jgi:5-methylcytosine-specific restriction endonuclease McrA
MTAVERAREWKRNNRERHDCSLRLNNIRVWYTVLAAYSIPNTHPSCQECGTIEDLTIDHIDQKGTNHRHPDGTRVRGDKLRQFLRKHNCPDGYRTLCMDCNHIAYALHKLGLDVSQRGFIGRAKSRLQ